MNSYIISRIVLNGDSYIIEVKYRGYEEYSFTICKNNQITDAFLILNINDAVSKCVCLQETLFGKVFEDSTKVYKQLLILKENN